MKDTLRKLKGRRYLTSIILVVLLVFMVGLFSILKPDLKNIKINKILTKTTSLNASVIDGVSEGVESNNYDEIKYQIKVNKDSSDTAIIIATLTDAESKYARFKEISNSVVSENGKKITITTTREKTNIIIIVENAPYGTVINPTIKINSEDESKSNINVDPVTITGKSVEGRVIDEKGTSIKGLELSLKTNTGEVKRTYTKDNGEYVFSLGETESYQVVLEEQKYKTVRYEEETTDPNRRILNIVIKEVDPFKVKVTKTINKLDLVINGKKETFNYNDETKVVRSVKGAKTIEGSVYYKINVKNEGETKGTLTVLKDIIPEGLSFDESKNPGWVKDGKYLFYTPLEDKEIGPFEQSNVSLVLDIVKTEEARNYINTAISSGENYKYVVYYLNNNIFREEYVIEGEKIKNIDPGNPDFLGWYTDRNYTNEYDFNNEVTKDIILYGKLKNSKYNVTFIDKNPNTDVETILDIREVEDGQPVEIPTAPVYSGYTFKCFKLNDACYNGEEITHDTELYTSYTTNEYDIDYDLVGGTVSTSNPIKYTVKDEFTLNNPSKEGYTFIGWTGTDLTEETETVTVTRGSIGNREYIANYRINRATLTVNPNGGLYNGSSVRVPIENDYGTIITLDTPTREGYSFTGWSLTGAGTLNGNSYTYADGDGEVTANYSPIDYNITYNLDGGSVSGNPGTYNITSDSITLNNPIKTGYTFTGWTGTGLDSKTLNVTIPSGSFGDRTYTANFDINQYTLTVNPNGGSYNGSINPVPIENDYGYILTLDTPTKTGYTFSNWTLTGEGTLNNNVYTYSDGDGTVTANYTVNTYEITYDGLTPEEITALANPTSYTVEDDITLATPSDRLDADGDVYERFTGWIDGTSSLEGRIPQGSTGNKHFVATFVHVDPDTYVISYDLDGGSVSTENPTSYTKKTATFTLNNPTKNGYNFAGWTGTGLSEATMTVTIPRLSTGNREYTATYTPISYGITYHGLTQTEEIALGNPTNYNIETATFNLANPTRTGYNFLGWTGSNGDTPADVTIPVGSTGDKTYTANFATINYTISYDYAGGTVETANPENYNIESSNITLNEPTKEGYRFIGWTGSNGDTPEKNLTIPTGSIENRSYTANYEAIEYTITYDGLTQAEITALGNPTTYTIETNTFDLGNPTRTGYNFLGWTGSNGETPGNVTITKGTTGNKTYNANFSDVDYTISYNLNGGDVSGNPDTYSITSSAITLNNPTKTGYNFVGWTGTDLSGPTMSVTIPSGSIGNREYTATYTPIVYNITYDYDGGAVEVANPSTYTIESEEITFNNPSKEGYTFTNFTIDNVITTSIPTGSTGDKHLVAHYQIRKYNVTFYNGSVIHDQQEVEFNHKADVPVDIPTKAHHIFLYWSEDGTTEYNFNTNITSDKNLYAVYEEVEAPTISINPDLDLATNRTYVCNDPNDSNCGVTITISSTHNDYDLYYKIGDEEPQLYSGPVKVYSNETVTAFAEKNNIASLETTKNITNVDSIAPVINTPETGTTSFDVTVSGTTVDSGSGVKKVTVYLKEKTALDYDDTYKYETEIFDGVKDQAESYTHTYNGMQDGTEYTVKIVSEDYVGNVTEIEVDVETNPYVARIVGMNEILWYTVDPDTKEVIVDPGKEFLLFGSIQAAVNYCASNQCTIQTNPINPVTNANTTIAANQDITIDLDGRGITSDTSPTFINNGKLTIVDRNPRETGEHEHDGIGFVKNTVGKAIVNNGTFTLGEGSSEEAPIFVVPEMDRPIIEGKTNALENNDKFNFFDGKFVAEGQALSGTGEDAVTQFMYNAILTVEDEKNVAILDRATDPEAKIRSTYYAKLKTNNGPNAYDSSRKGSLSKDEYKILSKIKQVGDYGFIYDAVNNEIYNGNQTTSNTTALSYIKLDLTDELNDQIIVFDTFADTYNSNSYGYVSVSETLANTGTQIYRAYGNDKVSGKVYELEKGKVYYIYFGFVKGAGDTNTYETFKVTNFNILGERESSSNLVLMNDPLYYSFNKQSDGSFISTNNGINSSYSHSYAVYDLRNTSDQYNLNISASISSEANRDYGYIYLSDSDTLQDVNTGTGRYMLISGEVEDNTITIPLTPGQLNYVNFVYYKNGNTHTGNDNFIINNISIAKLETEDLIPTTSVEHGSSDTYYFNEVNGNPYIWVDRSGNNNNADIYSNVYDPDNYGFTFNNYSHMAISGSNLGLTNYEESVYLEFSTESTGNALLYMGSTNERVLIGVYAGRLVVSNAGNANTYTLPSDYADGNKHSFLVTYNGGNYELYYDGVLLEKLSYTDYFSKADGNLHLGRRGNGEYPFYGKIYNFKLFNKELTPEELDNTENLVINLDGTNPFSGDGHQYYSNNRFVANSTAHSYIPYDLTNIDEDKYLYINTRISSQGDRDYGYVYVTNSPDLPSGASGRAITLSGDYADRNTVVRLKKNQMNYVHFVYTKNGSNDYYTDTFYIKEMKYFNNEVDAYSYDPAAYQILDTYYFDKPVYNQTVDTIELLKDVTINTSIVVPEEQEVILDLNGFTLTSEKNDYIIKNNGKLTITDSEFEERHNANVDYVTEQARLYNLAKTQYLTDKAEYEEYAGLCDGCEPSDEYKFDHLEDYKDYFGISDVAEEFVFDYVSSSDDREQTFTVPHSGLYKLEVWGAQGGDAKSYTGGYGGYATGAMNLTKDDVLYINVGGQGSGSTATEYIPGGYNGGGTGKGGDCGGTANNRYGASGGGATSIATVSGELKDLDEENDKENILIVAGGGGGAVSMVDWYQGAGGSGGGAVGVSGYVNRTDTGFMLYSTGGTQTAGGTGGTNYAETSITPFNTGGFGYGGSAPDWETCGQGGAGGGGLYGGGAGVDMSGAGGSGYIGNEELVDKKMVCYNCAISSVDSTKTESTTCNSATPTVDCAKRNSGYAKITLLFNQDIIDDIRNNLPKTYNVKSEPMFVNYLSNIDFDSSIDPSTITPDSEVSFNIDESHVGGITTTLASAILNEQYGILTLKNIAINVNVDSKIGIENRGSLLVSDSTEINVNNSSTIGIFNESNGSLTFNDSVINANGSSTIGLLNRSNTPLIEGVKVTTATTNGTGVRDESVDYVAYNNLDVSGAGLAFRMYSNAGDSSITNSNLKSTGNESFYLEGEGKQTKLTISNTNFNGRFYINRSPKEIVISNSTLSSVLNTIGNITLNSSSLNDITNRGMARINNSTITSTGTAINNQGNPEHGDAEQFTANMIINNSIINSTATSTANVISNSDRLNVHNSTINNINGTKSTAFNNASATGATAYLTIDGNTIIDSSFGTAISNTGLLTLGSNKNGIGEVYNYGYTGHQEEFVAPVSGTYKLETWGASGAESPHSYGEWRFAHGGFGGYASGTITLNAGDKLYIHVGGVGSEGVVYSTSYPAGGYNLISYYGSYNGGGSLSGNLGTRSYGGSGGGATDISLSNEDNTWSYDNGVATNTRSNSSYEQRIVVAGGGSGGGTGSTTKYGGYTGDSSTSQLGFGSSGGGGGYYGGTYGIGGSSYVSDTLTDIVMINGNNDMPNYDSAGIVRGNVGNGYAKITLIDTSNTDTVDSSPTISATNYGITGAGRIVYYDGTVSANKAFNSSIESVPDNYDIYKSVAGDTENVVLIPNSDVRPVSPGEEEYVCKIGGTKYTTIQNAVDAANTGDTIELLVDINQQNMVTIPDGKNLTIDYNGHTVISYNNNALFNITSTSASDSDPGITIKDSQRALLDNYGYGNTYIINDGKLSIENLKFYDIGNQKSFIENNGKLVIKTSDIYYGQAGQNNGTAIKNNVSGDISIIDSNTYVYNANHANNKNTIIKNDGTANIKDTSFIYNRGGGTGPSGSVYFVYNNATGTMTLDNSSITFNNRGWYESYNYVNNAGDLTIKNHPSFNPEGMTNTGTITLENNTFTAGTLSSSESGLVRINSGTYSNTFNISGTGRAIDGTDNLYSLIMEDGSINTTLNLSSTGITNIKAGTISVNSGYAINNTGAGIITLGINDSSAAPKADTRPIISGATYGIYTNNPNAVINFYDGIVSGQTAYNLTVDDIETGYSLRRDYDSDSDREEKYLTNEPMFTNATQGINYATVAEFNNAINNGSINNDDEIIVYRNITISKNDPTIIIPSGLNITFDINGKVIDKGNNLMIENNGTLTITDSITDSTGKIDSTSGNIVENNGTLNILKGTYVSQRDSKETAIIMNTLGSTLNISDGNFTKYYDKLDELNQQDRGFGSIINNSGDVTITGGHYTINSSHRRGYLNRIANYIYTSNVFWNTSTGVINASNITADGFASVDIDADNKQYTSTISYNAEGQMFHNDGILNISDSVSTNSLIGDNTGTVVMEDVTMNKIYQINNIWDSVKHKPIVNSGTFTIKGGNYTTSEQIVKNTGTFIITLDSLGNGTTITRNGDGYTGRNNQGEDSNSDMLIYNKTAGNVEIDGATFLADSISTSAIVANSSSGQVNISNSILKTNNYPTIINNGVGEINVNNSTLTTKAHNTINNNSTGTVCVYGNSTEVITDSGIGIYNNSTGTINIGKLKTEDSSLSQTNPLVVGSTYGVSNTKGTFNFYDGILKGKTAAKTGSLTNIEPNYSIIEPTDPVDDYYVAYLDRIYVVENANDSTKKYYSIADAFDDAIGGEEFKMIANYSTTIDIPTATADNNITFDLNGYTITQGNSVLFTNNSNLTIVDSSTNKTGAIVVASGSKAFDNYGTLNLNAGNISTNSGILFVTNNTGSTLNIRNHAKLDSSVSSTLIDNSGTTNIYNGAYLHTVNHNIIINRNILNVIDLNNDDDNSTSSEYDAPWIYCPDNRSGGSYHSYDDFANSSIENKTGATVTMYGGIYNNGQTYDTGSPNLSSIIRNYGTANIYNLNNYSFVLGYNAGTIIINNSHFYNFENYAISNEGNITINDTAIETTTNSNAGTDRGFGMVNYGTINLNNVSVTTRTQGNGRFSRNGTLNITDSNINYSSNYDSGIRASNMNITNSTVNSNTSISVANLNVDSSDLSSSSLVITTSGTTNIKNGSTVSSSGGNAINTSGTLNILDTSRVVSTNGYGIYLDGNGTLNIGEIGGTPSVTDPYIEGSTYGVYRNTNTSRLNFYDGLVVGQTGPNAIYGGVTNVEGGYETTDIIDPDDNNRHHEFLVVSATSVAIAKVGTYTFSSNGSINSSQALQNAINFAIGDGTNVKVVDLVANVDLTADEVSLTASSPVTVNLNGKTITSDSTYTIDSNINPNGGNLGGSISKLLSNTFGVTQNPKNIIIYELSDGSELDVTKTYKLYKDGNVTKLEKEELGRYKYQGDTENLVPIKGRLYIDNLGEGSYRLESIDNKYIEFSIDSDGNISGNVTENTKSSDSSSAVATSNAELILTIQTGIERHYYGIFIIPIILIIAMLVIIGKNRKREI